MAVRDLQDVLKSHQEFLQKVKKQVEAVAQGKLTAPPLLDKQSLLEPARARLAAARKAKEEAVQRFDREIAEQEKTVARLEKEIADDRKVATAGKGAAQQAAALSAPEKELPVKALPSAGAKKRQGKPAGRKKSSR